MTKISPVVGSSQLVTSTGVRFIHSTDRLSNLPRERKTRVILSLYTCMYALMFHLSGPKIWTLSVISTKRSRVGQSRKLDRAVSTKFS